MVSLDIRKRFFTCVVIEHQKAISADTVMSTSLSAFKSLLKIDLAESQFYFQITARPGELLYQLLLFCLRGAFAGLHPQDWLPAVDSAPSPRGPQSRVSNELVCYLALAWAAPDAAGSTGERLVRTIKVICYKTSSDSKSFAPLFKIMC